MHLKVMQANAFVFYTKAHGYHWNVEGVLFKELHAFFKEIYEGAFDLIDDYAEWSRKLNQYAPFQLDEILSISHVQYDISTNSPLEMVRNLIESNSIILNDLNIGFTLATQANQQALANFIAERIDQHQFWNWQLTSTAKVTIN